ncbi:MAG: TonB-dependent receptor, partial [Deltaproteobacteria bacterium]
MVLSGTLLLPVAAGAEETAEAMGEIQVIGVTPSHGVGLPIERIPTNVQSATSEDLERAQALDLSDFMNRNLGSVNINAAQNNPLQPDVQYRGFTASPLLGLPQGLAVYQNGVRVNEAFGDTVNWDLIPKSAIDSINLIGGANPIFGLNTLGGALSVQTKNGFTWQGTEGEVMYGSFDRLTSSIATGGNNGVLGWFAAAEFFREDGWRDHSDSDAWNAFAALSWQNDSSTLDLIYSHGDTNLKGNGPAPAELLAIDREAVFTHPDITENLMNLIDLE